MVREGSIMYNSEMREFKKQLEEDTGFVCYEVQPGDQTVFYGTSDKLVDFREAVGDRFNTGTIVYCVDTGTTKIYSKYKDQWYDKE